MAAEGAAQSRGISSLRCVSDGLTAQHSGGFFNVDGTPAPGEPQSPGGFIRGTSLSLVASWPWLGYALGIPDPFDADPVEVAESPLIALASSRGALQPR